MSRTYSGTPLTEVAPPGASCAASHTARVTFGSRRTKSSQGRELGSAPAGSAAAASSTAQAALASGREGMTVMGATLGQLARMRRFSRRGRNGGAHDGEQDARKQA